MDYSKPPPKPPRNYWRIYFCHAYLLLLSLVLYVVGAGLYHEGMPERIAETEYGAQYVPEEAPGRLAYGVMMVSGAVVAAGGVVSLTGTGIAHASSRMRRSG